MGLMQLMLINTGIFSIILVVLLVVWVNKPKNGYNGSNDVHGDLYKIKENVSTEEKDPVVPAGRLDTIQSL